MNIITINNNDGNVIDIIYTINSTVCRHEYKRYKCFCFIESINDYAFMFVVQLALLRHKRKLNNDKSNYSTQKNYYRR
jgi:hypothetical protein